MAPTDILDNPTYGAAREWLGSPQARRLAERELFNRRLYVEPDAVTDDALRMVWHRLTRNPHGIDNVAAYCTTAVKNVVRRTVEGFSPDATSFGSLTGTDREPEAAPMTLSSPSGSSELIDALRTSIEVVGSGEAWVTAAALNYVTLSSYPDVDVGGSPTPRAGANPNQARMWPCLWFAGKRHGLFPEGASHDAAQRQRLSRTAARVHELVASAAAEAELRGSRRG